MSRTRFQVYRAQWLRVARYAPVICLLLAGCATNPVTGRNELHLVSEGREVSIGEGAYIQQQQAQGGPYLTDPDIDAYVKSVGNKLVAVSDRSYLPYEFVVLNNSVPNAWALPGGKIAVNRGLLTELKSEAELAAVLGHEIVHVAARHGAKSIERGTALQVGLMGLGLAVDDHDYRDYILQGANVSTFLVTMKYGRSAELEADEYGIKYMVKAGYDPHAAVELQETFLRLANGRSSGWLEGLLASHPPSRERVIENAKSAQAYPPAGFRGEAEYQTAIAPLRASKPAYEALEKGYVALKEGRTADALKLSDEGIKITPREAHLFGLKAKGHLARGELQASRAALDEAIALNNQYFEFYLLRGKARESMGDVEGARKDLERSTSLLPTASAHLQLGLIAQKSGRSSEAIRHFELAAKSETTEGVQAFQSLAQLDMPSNPARYLGVQYRLNKEGFVAVGIVNETPVTVAACTLSVYSPAERRWVAYTLPAGIPPGTVQFVQTGVGPYPDVHTASSNMSVRFQKVVPAAR
ncbi:MAG: M48 family metalloprotease [Verrucomicrobia bacterium]|nr:M48 family metalloprotease [Verrucomicrobiota bacterium]